MKAYRNGEKIIMCDGCFEPIVGKTPFHGKFAKVKPRPEFHNRKCADRYSRRGDQHQQKVPATVVDMRQGYRPTRPA